MSLRYLIVLMVALSVSTTVAAKPYAPVPPHSADGKAYLNDAAAGSLGDVPEPDAGVVNVPVFPGALFINASAGGRSAAGNVLPTITLVTTATPDQVDEWYKTHLQGWTWDGDFELFVKGDHGLNDFRRLFSTPHVFVQQASAEDPEYDDYQVRGIHARIEIAYRPRLVTAGHAKTGTRHN
jgi:hypothetical protein